MIIKEENKLVRGGAFLVPWVLRPILDQVLSLSQGYVYQELPD